ncbi:hypothetical protein JYU16_00290 [bacterium AH-315-M05]|nr:hypothetical protein [bacterium AH-315-M05]
MKLENIKMFLLFSYLIILSSCISIEKTTEINENTGVKSISRTVSIGNGTSLMGGYSKNIRKYRAYDKHNRLISKSRRMHMRRGKPGCAGRGYKYYHKKYDYYDNNQLKKSEFQKKLGRDSKRIIKNYDEDGKLVETIIIKSDTVIRKLTSSYQPERAEGIPDNAFWIGGVDGGRWYVISNVDKNTQMADFKIYNDYTGDLIFERNLKLYCSSDYDLKWDNLKNEINFSSRQRVVLTTIDKNHKYCYFE